MHCLLAAGNRRPWYLIALVVVAYLALTPPGGNAAAAVPDVPADGTREHSALSAAPETRHPAAAADPGIAISSVRLSAAGYMLDVRFRITDPGKAARMASHATKPYLIDEVTGARMLVPSPPKVGALRQMPRPGAAKTDRTYFMLFANPGRLVKAGSSVTLVLGDFRAEHLAVQ